MMALTRRQKMTDLAEFWVGLAVVVTLVCLIVLAAIMAAVIGAALLLPIWLVAKAAGRADGFWQLRWLRRSFLGAKRPVKS